MGRERKKKVILYTSAKQGGGGGVICFQAQLDSTQAQVTSPRARMAMQPNLGRLQFSAEEVSTSRESCLSQALGQLGSPPARAQVFCLSALPSLGSASRSDPTRQPLKHLCVSQCQVSATVNVTT